MNEFTIQTPTKLNAEIQRIDDLLIHRQKDYLRQKGLLEYRLEMLKQDHELLTKNKRQRLAVLKDGKRRLKKITKPVLATFTFKSELKNDEDAVHFVTERFYPFINRLSQSVFKNAYRRYKKKVDYLAAYEVDWKTRLNAHAILNCPDHIDEYDFKSRIDKYWYSGRVEFQDTAKYHTDDPSDFGNYCYKEKSKDLRTKNFSEYLIP